MAADGIAFVNADGVFVAEVRTDQLRVVPGSERHVLKPDPNVLTGDVLDTRHIIQGIVALDRYDEAVTVTTDWQKR